MTTTGPHLRVLTAEAWSPVEPYRQRRTEAFYRWAGLECVRQGRHRVLDLGCGDGLGSAVLTAAGCRVVGVDQDNSALELARRTFRSDRLVFRAARPPQCDEPQHSFDAVVCAGLVERLADPRPLLDEVLRVLRPSGLLIARTPNRLTASPGRTRPLNGSHAWEYTAEELDCLLRSRFPGTRMWGLFHGRRLRALETVTRESLGPLLDRVPPCDRAPWLRFALKGLLPWHFKVRTGQLREAQDLLALATA